MKTLHLAVATILLSVSANSAHAATVKNTFVIEQDPLVTVHTGNTPARGRFDDTYTFTVAPNTQFASGVVTVQVGDGANMQMIDGIQAILDETIGFEHSPNRFGAVFLTLDPVALAAGNHSITVSGTSYGGSYAMTMETAGTPSQVPIPGLVWLTGAIFTGLVGWNESRKTA